MAEFEKLFEPGKIGRLEVKNRIVMAPMVTRLVTDEGGVSDRLINYYIRRAEGGAGLIVVESSFPRSEAYPGRICLGKDKSIPGLRNLARAIQDGGAKAIIQINPHRGRVDNFDPASASDVPHPVTGVRVRGLGLAEIMKLEEEFGEAVRRAKEAGFDGVMIHGANGYLVSDFLSPRTNRRTDEYGGDAKGRAKFALELVDVAKRKTEADYPVIFRLAADERVKEGFQLQDAITVCRLLQEGGADAVDIVSGTLESAEWASPYMYVPHACNTHLSEAIKKEIRIPVLVAGRINDPFIAEGVLEDGKADFIDLGRALIADPEFPRKASGGRAGDICKCIACLRCVESVTFKGHSLQCTVNPEVGREFEPEPASKKKRVLIVGSGPAGMEAAVKAAQRGHDVTLWEKEELLGGQLRLAAIPPGKEEFNEFLEFLKRQLKNLGVRVELNREAIPEAVLNFSPDSVIVATGSSPFRPDIPGIYGENVMTNREALTGERETGQNVIVVGGKYVGCETAIFLAEKGKKVTMVFRSPKVASGVIYPIKVLLLKQLKENGVEIFAGVKHYKEITQEGLRLIDKEGKEVLLEANSIVLATGATPNKTLAQALKHKVPELYEVGDCLEARQILEAVHEGAEAALKI